MATIETYLISFQVLVVLSGVADLRYCTSFLWPDFLIIHGLLIFDFLNLCFGVKSFLYALFHIYTLWPSIQLPPSLC